MAMRKRRNMRTAVTMVLARPMLPCPARSRTNARRACASKALGLVAQPVQQGRERQTIPVEGRRGGPAVGLHPLPKGPKQGGLSGWKEARGCRVPPSLWSRGSGRSDVPPQRGGSSDHWDTAGAGARGGHAHTPPGRGYPASAAGIQRCGPSTRSDAPRVTGAKMRRGGYPWASSQLTNVSRWGPAGPER